MSNGYKAKKLGSLDAKHPYLGTIKIVIEHSLGEGKDQYVRKEFKNLKSADQWLKKREISDGFPARQTKPLEKCKKGVCTYNFDGGILHNNLYLQKITYVYSKGRPVIKAIYLLDGD